MEAAAADEEEEERCFGDEQRQEEVALARETWYMCCEREKETVDDRQEKSRKLVEFVCLFVNEIIIKNSCDFKQTLTDDSFLAALIYNAILNE